MTAAATISANEQHLRAPTRPEDLYTMAQTGAVQFCNYG
jgi:hypothetical protein